jgi:phosphatidylserine decarboxylase
MMIEQKWPVAREGIPFVIPPAALTLFFAALGWVILTFLGFLVTLFIAFFFRNPKREIPDVRNAVLAAADGTIVDVGECTETRFLKEKAIKVSIFMSVLDVHLNRAPVSGRVIERSYHPGRFLLASREKSSLLNEQNAIILETQEHAKILLVQIAGLVARRIVCYVNSGNVLAKGQIFGLIRFGSRVDLYLPASVKPTVWIGQHVKGGESIIGYLV